MTRRTDRLAAGMQRQLAEHLKKAQPSTVLLTVTRVVVSPDNRTARVWIAGWNDLSNPDQREMNQRLQAEIAQRSTTKFTPQITCVADTSAEYVQTIDRLLD